MLKLLKVCFLILMFSHYNNGFAQEVRKLITVKEYVEKYKEIAIYNMNTYRIPASITLGQGILESNTGNSDLAVKANNHFGIKCHKEWKGETYIQDDDTKDECFRVYKTPEESYRDHSAFLRSRKRYASLFYLGVADYKAWAEGLKAAGYATNPKYPQLLIKVIEDNKLYEYDSGYPKKEFVTSLNPEPANYSFRNSDDEDEDFSPIYIEGNNRRVFLNNDIRFIFVKEGDSFQKIADDLEMSTNELYRYNDFPEKYKLKVGEKVYIESKSRSGFAEFHIVQKGDDMLSISQFYGIKLKQLYKKNRMKPDDKLKVGQKLWLKKKKPE